MQFSLFYFSGDGLAGHRGKYSLLIEGARFADEHGFTAVWTPERHFGRFGGLYPSPTVSSAALATITRKIGLRAGSIVQPLQNPIRVAEEWSMLDNISNGRVGVAFASGWHANDFVLAPENYRVRRDRMYKDLEVIQKLWRGEQLEMPNGLGSNISFRILPRPLQEKLPIWLTAQSDETFRKAASLGFNVLTNYNYKTPDELRKKLALYRDAEENSTRERGQITLMVHTFVTDRIDQIGEFARPAIREYLTRNIDLQAEMLHGQSKGNQKFSEDDVAYLLDRGVDRLLGNVALIGTPESCVQRVHEWHAMGVDEIACLIDFGLPNEMVLSGLQSLVRLMEITG